MRNPIVEQVKDYIRQPYAWPGGYTKVLYMADGECLCVTCAKDNYRIISGATRNQSRCDWQAIGVDLYQEGPDMHCANCNAVIESDYGDPDSE